VTGSAPPALLSPRRHVHVSPRSSGTHPSCYQQSPGGEQSAISEDLGLVICYARFSRDADARRLPRGAVLTVLNGLPPMLRYCRNTDYASTARAALGRTLAQVYIA